MFPFHKKNPQNSARELHPSDANALRSSRQALEIRSDDLDRRESVLNARVAALESLMRSRDDANVVSARAEANDLTEFNKIADALEVRERKLAELAGDLRERELALEQRRQEFHAQETELARKKEEVERVELRLIEIQEELDEKERIFESRSTRTLETIRLQKEELQQLRKAA